jgi:predicted DNA-binding transcriptional regulator AlpA
MNTALEGELACLSATGQPPTRSCVGARAGDLKTKQIVHGGTEMEIAITPRLVDVRGVAQLYSVSERSVWRLTKEGQIPAPVRLGRRATRWRLDDLLEHISILQTEVR